MPFDHRPRDEALSWEDAFDKGLGFLTKIMAFHLPVYFFQKKKYVSKQKDIELMS